VSCAPSAVEEVLALFRREGFAHAAVVGEMCDGPAQVQVVA
jgi:selenide, water dikinase